MDRRALAALAGLVILSVAVMLGSVVAALASFDEHELQYSAIELPEGLLSPEPADAVRHKPATPDLVEAIVEPVLESPIPAPTGVGLAKPAEKPKETLQAVTAPQEGIKTPRFEISMASAARGRGGNRTISYEITVKNVGEVSLANLVVRSHVPSATSWEATASCDRNGHEVVVTYADGKERSCMGGSQTIQGDPNTHPVEATLKTMTPGMTAVISFSVDVSQGQSGTVTNHAHLSGGGIEMQSGSTTDNATPA